MFMIILGIIDMIAGAMLSLSGLISLAGNGWVFWFGVISLLKGLYSILTAMAAQFYFDVMGIIDLLVGIFLLMSFYNITNGFFVYIGIVMLLKAAYTIVMGVVAAK